MRRLILFACLVFIVSACSQNAAGVVYIVDGGRVQQATLSSRVPREVLQAAGISLGDHDRLLLNGTLVSADSPINENGSLTFQIRRAIQITVQSQSNSQVIETSAFTVGEALSEAGITLYRSDFINPPADTPIQGPLIVAYVPSREIRVFYGNTPFVIRSAAGAVEPALAEAGIPLIGLDTSFPSANEALPADGQMRVVRVRESLALLLKPIPFESEYVVSDDVELDQTEVIQPGVSGLSVSRTRVRYEDEKQVSRQIDGEVVVRSPQKRVLGYGTKVVTHTLNVGGAQIEYWRAVPMFATSYSPCRSGTSACFSGTSLGLPVKKGVVAMKYDWYLQLQGQRVYIPGYGVATVADVGGGYPDGRPWIDLGYSDSDWQEWGDWVTVYFLTPVPDTIPYILR